MTGFTELFCDATGLETPFPYQRALAEGRWPEVLDIPTGLGKTAAVTLAWLYRRQTLGQTDMPRRLVWCLPMRVLVEQTHSNIRQWLETLDLLGEPGEAGKVAVHVLMGGESDLKAAHWAHHPEQDAILIGTQDMLLSRALMRGYGMSRYQWPVHYALLHHDAQWVFDEVQLMGAALPTSAQLEGLRRALANGETAPPARSLWISATLRPEWLSTVDFRPHVDHGLGVLALSEEDRACAPVQQRLEAPKALAPASAHLAGSKTDEVKDYIASLASEVAAAHVAGTRTLVILNRVERAQALYRALAKTDTERVLLHARFRPAERRELEQRITAVPGEAGQIVIATQAIEAGVDLSSRTLFTELAPWSSLVQRLGRCNRAGEFDAAAVYWMDLAGDDKDLLPYTPAELDAARERLRHLTDASPGALPPVDAAPEPMRVLRRRDLVDLFNTDPDLSGFDVDVSPYIRDAGSPQLQVFWRDFEDAPDAQAPAPARDELCNVSLSQLREHLKKSAHAWIWDPLHRSDDAHGARIRGRWRRLDSNEVRPGQTLLLCAAEGGYKAEEGFVAASKEGVPVLAHAGESEEDAETEQRSPVRRWLTLGEHTDDVVAAMEEVSKALRLPAQEREDLATAARWHDIGKAHEAFQRGIGATPSGDGPWAKSDSGARPAYHVLADDGESRSRPGFRHELASMLAWLAHGDGEASSAEQRDRIAYWIAAHHGRVRLGLRALPTEAEPPEADRLFARGIWEGDCLPSVVFNGLSAPETALHLDLMKLGEGPQGPSWSERTHRLLQAMGPFHLAWLEALLRVADRRASARETAQ